MHQVIEQYFLDKGLNVKYWDDEKLQLTLEKKQSDYKKVRHKNGKDQSNQEK